MPTISPNDKKPINDCSTSQPYTPCSAPAPQAVWVAPNTPHGNECPTKAWLVSTCVNDALVQVYQSDNNGAPSGTPLAGAFSAWALVLPPQKVEVCAPPPAPVANLKIEFSETLLYSASTEQKFYRIREYNEDTGVWTVRYENEAGATVAPGSLPADLTAVTAQVHVTRTTNLGCANGVPYLMRETARFDAETGVMESEVIDWVNSAGVVSAASPAGFTLGPCPILCSVSAPVGLVSTWG